MYLHDSTILGNVTFEPSKMNCKYRWKGILSRWCTSSSLNSVTHCFHRRRWWLIIRFKSTSSYLNTSKKVTLYVLICFNFIQENSKENSDYLFFKLTLFYKLLAQTIIYSITCNAFTRARCYAPSHFTAWFTSSDSQIPPRIRLRIRSPPRR